MEENRSRVADAISSLPPSLVEEMVTRLKEEGNEAYTEKDYDKALEKWGKGVGILKAAGLERSQLSIAIRSNVVMVFLKTGMYEYVLIECNDILEIDPRNAKILARRAKANTSLADRPGTGETFDERKAKHNQAIEDLNKCIEILDEGCLDAAKMKLKKECEEDLRCLFRRGDDFYTELAEGRDGLKHHMNSGKFISVYVLFDSIHN